ncbi:hypothetical protein SAMN05443246_5598 [Paenibacillus sp. GP183]|nr:hypothetical protein SAMN05443246_5598 [Paenibacillus sp. GP183]
MIYFDIDINKTMNVAPPNIAEKNIDVNCPLLFSLFNKDLKNSNVLSINNPENILPVMYINCNFLTSF